MTEDYLIFGAGYNGEKRGFEAGLEMLDLVTKPIMLPADAVQPPIAPLEFINFRVAVALVNGKGYNIACGIHRPALILERLTEVMQRIKAYKGKGVTKITP